MEIYKKRLQDEKQMIQHIKSIAKDLILPNSPQKYRNLIHQNKPQKGSASKQFVKTHKYEGKFRQINPRQLESSRAHLPTTFSHSRSKSKKKPIFGNFDEFWSKCSKQPQRKQMTPIMQRINKNIYSRFKTESKAAVQMSQNILNSSQRQQKWEKFLKRQSDWQRQRKDMLRQSCMRAISRQSPQLKRRTSNTNYKQVIKEREMSEVQASIAKLRYQAQKLKMKIQKINNSEQKQKTSDKKRTYQNC